MSSSLTLTALVAVFCWLSCRYVLHLVAHDPLKQLPQIHATAAISRRWFDRQVKIYGELKTLLHLHTKYGPIVRLGPREVSVVSQEGLRKVYVSGFDKTEWYRETFPNYGVQNLVCTLDHSTHARMRKMIALLYTKSYLQHSDDLDRLSRRILYDRLMPLLQSYLMKGMDVNTVELFEWSESVSQD